MATRRCRCCGKVFRPRPQVPDQQYCSERACQNARKRAWQQQRRQQDPDYRENQRRAQKRWAARHPDYWRQWREAHPAYQERNRRQQIERNARRQKPATDRNPPSDEAVIAKSDVWTRETGLDPGTYRVIPWADGMDCKDGRVNPSNLFSIRRIDSPAG